MPPSLQNTAEFPESMIHIFRMLRTVYAKNVIKGAIFKGKSPIHISFEQGNFRIAKIINFYFIVEFTVFVAGIRGQVAVILP
jgi:hypothetical protein